MGGGVDLPADEDVAAGSTQVGVGDELNIAAHALDLGQDLVVPVLILLEDDDGQGVSDEVSRRKRRPPALRRGRHPPAGWLGGFRR